MILHTRGKTKNITEDFVTKVTRLNSKAHRSNYILISDKESNQHQLSVLNEVSNDFKGLYAIASLDHLDEDDIVLIGKDGNLKTLYRSNSMHNSLFVTERCNSNCLMCSQPPMDRDDIAYIHEVHKQLIPLIPKDCLELGITGGEPTILGDTFFELLDLIKHELPDTEIHILSNGRSFSHNKLAEKTYLLDNPRIMFGIPIYSDYYQKHDYIVQSKNAFYQTIMGIHNLKRYEIRVEIRIVLHKLTIPRLKRLAEYIYRNLSFVDHVAFMGLEIMGYTRANLETLWIDPEDYKNDLMDSVVFLDSKKIHVSIYNTPLCLIPQSLWPWSRNSISEWKNIYLDECKECSVFKRCGGFFSSSQHMKSDHIKAITSLVED